MWTYLRWVEKCPQRWSKPTTSFSFFDVSIARVIWLRGSSYGTLNRPWFDRHMSWHVRTWGFGTQSNDNLIINHRSFQLSQINQTVSILIKILFSMNIVAFFLNGDEISLNEANSRNLINYWSINLMAGGGCSALARG